MTLRQLRVLAQNLPADCATGRAARGHNWTDTHYMLADLFDRVGALVAVTVAANSKDGKVKEPEPFPRPDQVRAKQERREQSTETALAYIEHYRQRREA